MSAPPQEVLDAILAPVTQVTRRVDIYEADNKTPWALDVPATEGSVSVDHTRAERRSLELTIKGIDSDFSASPGNIWYDKVIRVTRGVVVNGEPWETRIGTFLIDSMSEPRFPKTISLTCRDFSKKLLKSKFAYPTLFEQGESLENVIKAIAINAGIEDFILPNTNQTLGREFLFDSGEERWNAIKDLATAYNYEVFFDPRGALVMREFRDPLLDPTIFTFETGRGGSLVDWEKSSSDARIYNHIAVSGEGTNQLPVYAEARNTAPTSPTRIELLGERTYEYASSFIETVGQAEDVAQSMLKMRALEEYDLSLDSVVIPWMEAGEIVEFLDPNATESDPTRFLLSSFDIPLGLEAMTSVAKRVTFVG